MANKRKPKKNQQRKPFNWKKNSKWLSIIFLSLVTIGYFFVTTENQSRVDHDLSVIGNGKYTVVQIHDPSCQLCRRLQSNVERVKPDFENKVQFKIANIKTPKGAEFAKKYKVPHVTLLVFNKNGRHINTLRGVQQTEQITQALSSLR